MPFEPGNQLAVKVKVIDGMIRSVLAQDDRGRLRKAVERALDAAADGSLQHLDWFATRLDGRAKTDDDQQGLSINITIANPLDNQALTLEHAPQAPASITIQEAGARIGGPGVLVGGGGGDKGNPTSGTSPVAADG